MNTKRKNSRWSKGTSGNPNRASCREPDSKVAQLAITGGVLFPPAKWESKVAQLAITRRGAVSAGASNRGGKAQGIF